MYIHIFKNKVLFHINSKMIIITLIIIFYKSFHYVNGIHEIFIALWFQFLLPKSIKYFLIFSKLFLIFRKHYKMFAFHWKYFCLKTSTVLKTFTLLTKKYLTCINNCFLITLFCKLNKNNTVQSYFQVELIEYNDFILISRTWGY